MHYITFLTLVAEATTQAVWIYLYFFLNEKRFLFGFCKNKENYWDVYSFCAQQRVRMFV